MKEEQVLTLIGTLFVLTDFFTLPFKSFFITAIFALAIYYMSNSKLLTVLILIVPQFILLMNKLFNKESFKVRKQTIQQKKENEKFTNPEEITKRIESMTKKDKKEGFEVMGIDVSDEDDTLVGADINEEERIITVPEVSIPRIGTVEKNPLSNHNVSGYDNESLNTALNRNLMDTITGSNIESIEVS